MRTLGLFAFIVMLLAIPLCAAETTLQYLNPPKGTRASETSQTLMEFKLQAIAPGGEVKNSFEQSIAGEKVREAEILAEGPDAPKYVKLTYTKFEQRLKRTELEPKTRTEVLNGKTYLVEKKEDGIVATDEKGNATSADELKALKADTKIILQSPSRFAQMFAGKKFQPGQNVEISEELREDLIGASGNGMKIEKFALIFKETRSFGGMECAVFTQDVVMNKPDKNVTINVELHGETVVGVANCWPVSVQLSGPIIITGEQGEGANKVKMQGNGKMMVSWNVSYGK